MNLVSIAEFTYYIMLSCIMYCLLYMFNSMCIWVTYTYVHMCLKAKGWLWVTFLDSLPPYFLRQRLTDSVKLPSQFASGILISYSSSLPGLCFDMHSHGQLCTWVLRMASRCQCWRRRTLTKWAISLTPEDSILSISVVNPHWCKKKC